MYLTCPWWILIIKTHHWPSFSLEANSNLNVLLKFINKSRDNPIYIQSFEGFSNASQFTTMSLRIFFFWSAINKRSSNSRLVLGLSISIHTTPKWSFYSNLIKSPKKTSQSTKIHESRSAERIEGGGCNLAQNPTHSLRASPSHTLRKSFIWYELLEWTNSNLSTNLSKSFINGIIVNHEEEIKLH